jgi:hypothetical protein
LAVLESERLAEADRALAAAYRDKPQDPLIIDAAARLAAKSAPEW